MKITENDEKEVRGIRDEIMQSLVDQLLQIHGTISAPKYLGSWRHLSVKIFRSRCIVKTFRDQSYIYMEAIYQISAQSETWIDTVSEGEVLAPFT